MKILVTGASGLLGANIAYMAAQRGADVLAAYNEHPVSIRGCRMQRLDILSQDFSAIRQFRPDCVVHCAAFTNVDGCEADPGKARLLNVEATSRLLKACEGLGNRFIFMSTDSVFGGDKPFHSEGEPVRPLNAYSRTKVEAERLVAGFPNHAVVRTNFYGFNIQEKLSFSEWLHSRFLDGEKINAFTDFFFSPILANNLSDAILELAAGSFTGTMHVAGDGRISKYEFALLFAEKFGFDKSLVLPKKMAEVEALKARRPSDCSLDISKAKSLLRTRILNIDSGIEKYKELYDSGYQKGLRGG
ncbi:MAG: SDR family oxidoreductase [Candidatus ainarchaeum sp.]|nr:SDR family oxidoreductase [Candidatus ainarchaeum sp.]MDD5096275.1 SDR family oxidoreductase [Candidatus ainarchaeum sp.]